MGLKVHGPKVRGPTAQGLMALEPGNLLPPPLSPLFFGTKPLILFDEVENNDDDILNAQDFLRKIGTYIFGA